MTDAMVSVGMADSGSVVSPASGIPTEELAVELLERVRVEGGGLVGPAGLLADLTKRVLEAGLEAEMTEHVGYAPHDPAGHHSGQQPQRDAVQDGDHRDRADPG